MFHLIRSDVNINFWSFISGKNMKLSLLCFLLCLRNSASQAQNNGNAISQTGPPLRFYSTKPENFRLETKIDGKVLVGEDLSLEVELPEKGGVITGCQWTSPYGTVYIIDKDNAEGEMRTLIHKKPIRKISIQ